MSSDTDDRTTLRSAGSELGVSGPSSRDISPRGEGANPVASTGGVGHSKPPRAAGSQPASPSSAAPASAFDGQADTAAQVQRDPFADDVLERLIASNQDYQRGHGHYIVPLAERLLAARADNTRLREEIRIREESQIPVIPHGAAVQLERLQVEVERLLAWHDKTVPVIAALAIYGEGASLPALVEKARALNEAHRG